MGPALPPFASLASHESDEFALLDRLERGEVSAVGDVYDLHHGAVHGFARRLVGDSAAAEDLVHEVFAALPKAAARFKRESSLRTFLLSMTVNHARHHLRAAARRRSAMDRFAHETAHAKPANDGPEHHAMRVDLARELSRALDTLPLDQRVAFVLCEVEERTSVDAAQIVGVPEATVRTRLFHAKKKLREELEKGGSDERERFERATRELRDTGVAPPSEVLATRARLMDTLKKRERRRTRVVVVLLPIAAVLAGGAAFAKNGGTIRGAWEQVAEHIGFAPKHTPAPPLVANVPAPSPEKVEQEAAEPAEDTPEPLAPAPNAETPAIARPSLPLPAPATPPSARRQVAPPPPAAEVQEPAPAAASAVDDGESRRLSLYKEAYKRHFVEQNYAAALAGWDDYIRTAPAGRLIVEARYNRAIALVRLGRKGEARAALLPFARGEVGGGYRQHAAQALLDALGGANP